MSGLINIDNFDRYLRQNSLPHFRDAIILQKGFCGVAFYLPERENADDQIFDARRDGALLSLIKDKRD